MLIQYDGKLYERVGEHYAAEVPWPKHAPVDVSQFCHKLIISMSSAYRLVYNGKPAHYACFQRPPVAGVQLCYD